MAGGAGQRAINGRALRREPYTMLAETLLDGFSRWAHTYLGMIPRYHMICPGIKSAGRWKFLLHHRERLEGLILWGEKGRIGRPRNV